jgi:prepilin-type N-terminal cleavage/methylation domain-containing protein
VPRAQRGFTLLEVLAALGAFSVAALFLLAAVASVAHWNAALAERQSSEAELGGLADRLESEEDSAWAIFTPYSDGRELDFFMRDARSRAHFWAYRYDSSAQTLQRVVYASPDAAAIADGPPLTGVVSFFAQTYPVTALQDSASPLFSELYASAALTPATVGFGFADRPGIAGGNQITYVRVATRHSVRALALATQTAPSGFTIVLRYTPAPSPAASARLTAVIATSDVVGHWQDCPDRSNCSNAEWPQYHWTQTVTSAYYQSFDGGSSWSQFDSLKTSDTGISGPTGGDLPVIPCEIATPADFTQACTPEWLPAAPPGTAGMSSIP